MSYASRPGGRATRAGEHQGQVLPARITGAGWKYTLRRALRGFSEDQGTDLAAALTYHSVLAVFPALIALFSLLGVAGQRAETIDAVMPIVESILGSSGSETIRPMIESLAHAPGAGLALILGLLTALWSGSGYVTGFSRAMNRIYGVREGRPIWKLRPIMFLITLVMLVLVVAVALMLVLSGGIAAAIGEAVGLSSTAVAVWNIAKWPVVIVVVMLIVAMLYHTTPNVKRPKFRWISIGAAFAIIVWIVASAAFGFYIVNFSNYASTYGAFAGAIIFLLWLWITNLALLFGAELDAELERSRELMAGIPAEREIQLPLRDHAKIVKDAQKEQAEIDDGRTLRRSAGRTADTEAVAGGPTPQD